MTETGYIDFWGFHPASAGWFMCGWVPASPNEARALSLDRPRGTAAFESGDAEVEASVVLFKRDDLGTRGTGIVVYIASATRFGGRLAELSLQFGPKTFTLIAPPGAPQLHDAELVARLRGILGGGFAGHRNEMTAVLARRGYTGADTVGQLKEPIKIGIDEVVLCKPDGVLLMGWLLAAPGAVASLFLVVGQASVPIAPADMLRVDRLDVADTVGVEMGLPDRWCGFVAFLPVTALPGDTMYLHVETRSREVGYLNLHTRHLAGMPAMRRLLDMVDVQYGDVRAAYDRVVGPALQRLNTERLRTRPAVAQSQFGTPPGNPRCSVIVPLYGRIDFLETQMGLMSAFPQAREWELIYVLDDPPRRRETEALAESVFARFGLPFKLLSLSENVGFAPANNIALSHARAEYVCFLNSDAFPQEGDWLKRLCGNLAANPDLGVVGGLLLFEDGAVQHEGMQFEPIQSLGGFQYPLHTRKGWRPRPGLGLERMDMITGACMVMTRQLAAQLGGFHEGYIIGDFEDCDLCAKVRAKGKTCAVDHAVRLYHLERRSQVSPDKRWRLNLTLHNAWLYDRRWLAADATETALV